MLKKALTSACIAFTALVTAYSLIILLIYSANPDSSLAISALRIVLFFPFTLAVSLANRLFEFKTLDRWLAAVLHFIITVLAFYLCLILPIGSDLTPTAMLIGTFLFAVAYAAVFAVLALRRAKLTREENNAKEYTPVYRKNITK